MQYENNAPTEYVLKTNPNFRSNIYFDRLFQISYFFSHRYFENLATNFEKQMQSYRQQIELLERHLVSLTQPYSLTPNGIF